MRIGSLFSGYGGLDLAVEAVTGASTAWVSDNDKGARKILAHRFPDAPNLGDITKVDWTQVEPVDVITGGFPCQDVSHAGKRAGMHDHTRTGLWSYMRDAIDIIRPALVVAENVRGLLSAQAASDVEPCPWCLGDGEGEPPLRALGAVLADLADIGYDAQWTGLRAADVGAPHGRFRVFVAAYPADSDGLGRQRAGRARGWRAGLEDGHLTVADSSSYGRDEGRPEPARLVRGSDAPERGHAAEHATEFAGSRGSGVRAADQIEESASDADGDGQPQLGRLDTVGRDADRRRGADTAWGDYEPAIRRWERVLARRAPAPTEPGSRGGQRLAPRFVEWMQGLAAGWVCDVPGLTRNEQLHALGNGVVPQQAAAALRHLLQADGVAA